MVRVLLSSTKEIKIGDSTIILGEEDHSIKFDIYWTTSFYSRGSLLDELMWINVNLNYLKKMFLLDTDGLYLNLLQQLFCILPFLLT